MRAHDYEMLESFKNNLQQVREAAVSAVNQEETRRILSASLQCDSEIRCRAVDMRAEGQTMERQVLPAGTPASNGPEGCAISYNGPQEPQPLQSVLPAMPDSRPLKLALLAISPTSPSPSPPTALATASRPLQGGCPRRRRVGQYAGTPSPDSSGRALPP